MREVDFNTKLMAQQDDNEAKGSVKKNKKKKVKLVLKSPAQDRSRQTVSTILKACSKIIIEESFFGVTTDKIAKEAGVSIGSLYQFFGNKESVVSAVIVDLFEKDLKLFKERLKELDSLDRHKKIEGLIQLGLDIYGTEVELRSKIQNIFQYLVDQNYYANLTKAYQNEIAKLIPEKPGRSPQLMAYLFVHAFIGMMETVVQEDPNFRSNKDLVQEIKILYGDYLLSGSKSH